MRRRPPPAVDDNPLPERLRACYVEDWLTADEIDAYLAGELYPAWDQPGATPSDRALTAMLEARHRWNTAAREWATGTATPWREVCSSRLSGAPRWRRRCLPRTPGTAQGRRPRMPTVASVAGDRHDDPAPADQSAGVGAAEGSQGCCHS